MDSSSASTRPASRSSAGSTPPTCTAAPTPSRRAWARRATGSRAYHDTMIDHDKNVGQLLDLLDELGIADDTFVMYTTDNGPHMNTWPDGAMTPFRSEKDTNWEGAFRVPLLVRWPGKIPAGVGVQRDRPAPRLAARPSWPRGRAGHRGEAQEGPQGRRQDLQGPYRRLQLAALPDRQGSEEPARRASSTSTTMAIWWPCATTTGRWCSWSSAARARCEIWAEPFTTLRIPKLFNLRTDPYERADITSNTYWDWYMSQGLPDHGRPGAGQRSSWRRSRTSRRARRRRASPSTRPWRR